MKQKTDKRYTAKIQIGNLTKAQVIAVEDMFAMWKRLGGIPGNSKWVSFYVNGNDDFHPDILFNDKSPQPSDLLYDAEQLKSDEYKIDSDVIAWKLRKEISLEETFTDYKRNKKLKFGIMGIVNKFFSQKD